MSDRDTLPGDEDEKTPVTCLACGGNFRILAENDRGYRMITCRWCTCGAMTSEQQHVWECHKGRMRKSQVRRYSLLRKATKNFIDEAEKLADEIAKKEADGTDTDDEDKGGQDGR